MLQSLRNVGSTTVREKRMSFYHVKYVTFSTMTLLSRSAFPMRRLAIRPQGSYQAVDNGALWAEWRRILHQRLELQRDS